MPLNRVDSEAYDLAQKVKVNFVGTTLKGLTDAIFACQDLVLKYKSFEKPKA
jgi:putative N-acetylmannosamine-6-phosphate epimerase